MSEAKQQGPGAERDARALEQSEALSGDEKRVARLRRLLRSWYGTAQRDLPWRRTSDAYAIWISEAMLQQTRVEAVIGHYARFMKLFPSVEVLAQAEEDQVLACWSGLGYYNRARTLRRAAQCIVAEHRGQFPRDVVQAKALPGVGAYTAGAVLSIAYGLGVPLVDGNVARVFSRLFAIRAELERGTTQRLLWKFAEILVPADSPDARAAGAPGTWNQALMELGATVCTPRTPACDACPLASECAAKIGGFAHELPVKRPKPAPIHVRIEVLVGLTDTRVLLVRRPATDRMGGLWEMPTREVLADDRDETLLWPRLPHGPAGLVEEKSGAALGQLSHSITKHRITADLRLANVRSRTLKGVDPEVAALFELDQLEAVGLTGLTRKVLKRLASHGVPNSGATGGAIKLP